MVSAAMPWSSRGPGFPPLEAVVHAVDHDAVGVGGLLGDHGGQGGEFRLGDGTVVAGLCQRLLEFSIRCVRKDWTYSSTS